MPNAQEENTSAEATAAARGKKAAKKARRKERDAALKAAEQPPPAVSSAASTSQHGRGASQVSTRNTEPAVEVVASVIASAMAQQAADAHPTAPQDIPAEPGLAAVSETSDHVTTADCAAPTSGAGVAAIAAVAAAEAGRLLPPGWDAHLGVVPAAHRSPQRPGAGEAGLTTPENDDDSKAAAAQRQASQPDTERAGLSERAGNTHAQKDDVGSDRLKDAASDVDALSQLLGGFEVSERDHTLRGMQHQTAGSPAEADAAGTAAPSVATAPDHSASRHRAAALPAHAVLLCPITRVCTYAPCSRCFSACLSVCMLPSQALMLQSCFNCLDSPACQPFHD